MKSVKILNFTEKKWKSIKAEVLIATTIDRLQNENNDLGVK